MCVVSTLSLAFLFIKVSKAVFFEVGEDAWDMSCNDCLLPFSILFCSVKVCVWGERCCKQAQGWTEAVNDSNKWGAKNLKEEKSTFETSWLYVEITS